MPLVIGSLPLGLFESAQTQHRQSGQSGGSWPEGGRAQAYQELGRASRKDRRALAILKGH